MIKLQLDEIQTYFDKNTKQELELCFDYYELFIDEVKVELNGVPLLKNESNNKIFFPQKTKYLIKYFVKQAKDKGKSGVIIKPKLLNDIRYPFVKEINFIYSHIDYEYIPGLMTSSSKDGFLTPVFFNLKVLNKYAQDPNYKLEIFSDTYGIIYGHNWHIEFGINKNKKVIMWLGDINTLPESEKYYLRSENIESDHCIHSEFYNAQIEAKWAEPSIQSKAIRAKNNLNNLINNQFNLELYTFHSEISKVLEDLNIPIYWNKKEIKAFIISLNEIFVESLNVKNLKDIINIITNNTLDVKGLKGLKLLEILIELHTDTKHAKKLLLPFFVLYDFRIIVSHLMSDAKQKEKKQSICDRLGIKNTESNYEEIYHVLIQKILNSYERIIEILESSF